MREGRSRPGGKRVIDPVPGGRREREQALARADGAAGEVARLPAVHAAALAMHGQRRHDRLGGVLPASKGRAGGAFAKCGSVAGAGVNS